MIREEKEKQRRLKIYQRMYKSLKKCHLPCHGFCYYASRLDITIDTLVELREFKPEDNHKGFLHARLNRPGELFFWFRRDWFGKQYRLYILRKVIRQLTKDLRQGNK